MTPKLTIVSTGKKSTPEYPKTLAVKTALKIGVCTHPLCQNCDSLWDKFECMGNSNVGDGG